MVALGPSVKAGFVNPVTASNADVGQMLAALLDLEITTKGRLIGRPMREAMKPAPVPQAQTGTLRSEPAPAGLTTVLRVQQVGDRRYRDSADVRVGMRAPPGVRDRRDEGRPGRLGAAPPLA